MNKFNYFFFLLSFLVYGQKSSLKVGSNPYTINSAAVMEIESTSKGFLPPRMTLAQRNLITTPPDGLIIYCTDCTAGSRMQYYTSPNWENMYDTPLAVEYIKDRNYDSADGLHQFIYKSVVIPMTDSNGTTYATWLNFNLGANYANKNHTAFDKDAIPDGFQDINAYGSLFQWGRPADGHELVKWVSATDNNLNTLVNGTSSVLSPINIPNNDSNPANNGKFITNNTFPYDWRNPQNDILWQGVAGINNPCPLGYRLPTNVELEKAFNLFNNISNGFNSNLKIPAAGMIQANGVFTGVGGYSYTWTSTVVGKYASNTYLAGNKYVNDTFHRAAGANVRCIKD